MKRWRVLEIAFLLLLGLALTLSLPAKAASHEEIFAQYWSVIQTYNDAQENDYYFNDDDAFARVDINFELWSSHPDKRNLCYALVDLANDGIPELFIAKVDAIYAQYPPYLPYQIYDTYGYDGKKLTRLFDTYSMGYRSNYYIMNGGIIFNHGSSSAKSGGYDIYRLTANSAKPKKIDSLFYDMWEGENHFRFLDDHREAMALISKNEFDGVINRYGRDPKTDINWYPISDMSGLKEHLRLIAVQLNGSTLSFDQPPIILDGRTLVPLRPIFEGLGAEVNWDQQNGTVTSMKNGKTLSLSIGSKTMMVDNRQVQLEVPVQLFNGRTLIPLRAIAEAFGAEVGWNKDSKTVTIVA